jgi:hypothetical protein
MNLEKFRADADKNKNIFYNIYAKIVLKIFS